MAVDVAEMIKQASEMIKQVSETTKQDSGTTKQASELNKAGFNTSGAKDEEIKEAYNAYMENKNNNVNDVNLVEQYGKGAKNSMEAYQNAIEQGASKSDAAKAANAFGRMNAAANSAEAANAYKYTTDQIYDFLGGKVGGYENSLPFGTFTYSPAQGEQVKTELEQANSDIANLQAQLTTAKSDLSTLDIVWDSSDIAQWKDVLKGDGSSLCSPSRLMSDYDPEHTGGKYFVNKGSGSALAQQLGTLEAARQYNAQIINQMKRMDEVITNADETVTAMTLKLSADGLKISGVYENGDRFNLKGGGEKWAEYSKLDLDKDGDTDITMRNANRDIFIDKPSDFKGWVNTGDTDDRFGGNLGADDILYRNGDFDYEYHGITKDEEGIHFDHGHHDGSNYIGVNRTPVPVGTFSSDFGGSRAVDGGHGHKGIDISGAAGTPISATVGGTVVYSGWGGAGSGYGGYGYCVAIKDENGYIHVYGHMQEGSLGVGVGQKIPSGTRLGGIGNTGKSFGNHLHYEVRVPSDIALPEDKPYSYIGGNSPGYYIDPKYYIDVNKY